MEFCYHHNFMIFVVMGVTVSHFKCPSPLTSWETYIRRCQIALSVNMLELIESLADSDAIILSPIDDVI